MTIRNVASTRLSSQRIAGSDLTTPGEVVRWMGALQAQDYQQALWAIGLRARQASRFDVEAAISSREIVRTWPQRGTLHFVPAEDARWMLELSAGRMVAKDARRMQQLELDEAILARCRRLVESALGAGTGLSRPRMMELFESAGISTSGQRGYHILWRLAQEAVICLGPMDGKQQTFVLLDEWVPSPRRLSRADALVELAARYFRSHGPATVHDFAWWAGLTVADARAGLEGAKPDLTSALMNARELWLAADVAHVADVAELSGSAPRDGSDVSSAHLLPGFDEYLLGYKDRGDVVSKEHAARIVPGGNGVFRPMTVVEGQVTGTWRRKATNSSVEVTLALFSVHDEVERASLVEAAQAYADFLAVPSATTTIE